MSYEALRYLRANSCYYKSLRLDSEVRQQLTAADPDFEDRRGRTIFYYAIRTQDSEVFDIVSANNPQKLLVQDGLGKTSMLIHAVKMQNSKAIGYLLPRSDINYTDDKGRDALKIAMFAGHTTLVQRLIDSGAHSSESHLQCLPRELLAKFFQHFKNFGDTLVQNQTYLHYSIREKSMHLPYGQLTTQNAEGKTAIEAIIETRRPGYYMYLIERGLPLDTIIQNVPFVEHLKDVVSRMSRYDNPEKLQEKIKVFEERQMFDSLVPQPSSKKNNHKI